jgi:hypothetical protein
MGKENKERAQESHRKEEYFGVIRKEDQYLL